VRKQPPPDEASKAVQDATERLEQVKAQGEAVEKLARKLRAYRRNHLAEAIERALGKP
jgi:hypothetical protein